MVGNMQDQKRRDGFAALGHMRDGELSALTADAEKVERLRANQNDLHRLRGEVTVFRKLASRNPPAAAWRPRAHSSLGFYTRACPERANGHSKSRMERSGSDL